VESEVASAIAALRAGETILVPTDTVYGLAAAAASEAAVRRLYQLKGRDEIQPTAVVFASLEQLVAHVPELADDLAAVVRALLPGALTLVVPNPRARYRWVCGDGGALGVRVPRLPGTVARIVDAAGPVVATSANLPGDPDPRRLGDVPTIVVNGVGAVVDGGELPGVPSTVVDLTGPEPAILREGAVSLAEVLARISTADTAR
jgi:L-threonylcarbamoyladenylate synthase